MKEIQYYLETITCDHLIYAMDHPGFIVCSIMENSIGLKKVKASFCDGWMPIVSIVLCITCYLCLKDLLDFDYTLNL